ncbi:hypothetical protein Tco_1194709 [Tanacetum coccineum]
MKYCVEVQDVIGVQRLHFDDDEGGCSLCALLAMDLMGLVVEKGISFKECCGVSHIRFKERKSAKANKCEENEFKDDDIRKG